MTTTHFTERCPGCGALVPKIDGPVHPYLEAAPGCWALYGEVLAREYGGYGYPAIHHLTVATYAAQHPGGSSRMAARSLAAHLAGLHLMLDRGYDFAQAADVISTLLCAKSLPAELVPPPSPGPITIRDVSVAADLGSHVDLVNRWAESTWAAWSARHATIHRWADAVLFSRTTGPEQG